MDIQTTLLLVRNFFPPEFDSTDEDGPSACFPGVFREDGDGGAPETGGVGGSGGGGGVGGSGGVDRDGDVGEGNGAEEVLKGLPSFLQQVHNISKQMSEAMTKFSKLHRTALPVHFKQHIEQFYKLRYQTE
ncbi:unnamed protein product [Dovyalis caffra]|uniref:Uncharacterized protein n=1 Tax=Dovyalis caffra TaxID=77055 RepID=A0AAV1SEQ7_9ROSI|nr:unnamed protein product [Dovyalis caffra]